MAKKEKLELNPDDPHFYAKLAGHINNKVWRLIEFPCSTTLFTGDTSPCIELDFRIRSGDSVITYKHMLELDKFMFLDGTPEEIIRRELGHVRDDLMVYLDTQRIKIRAKIEFKD